MALAPGQYQNNLYDPNAIDFRTIYAQQTNNAAAAALAAQAAKNPAVSNWYSPDQAQPDTSDPKGSFGESDFNTDPNRLTIGQNGGSNGIDMSGYPGAPSYNGPSGAEMAASEFGPQYEALRRIMEGAQNNYNTGNKDLGNMYDVLSKQILGQDSGIRAQYDQSGQRIGAAYNDAIKNAGGVYNESAGKLAEMMQRLGIGQAAGYTVDQSQKNLAQQLGWLTQNSTSRQDYNTAGANQALDYNRGLGNTALLAGRNKQADLLKAFQAIQEQNSLKELDLKSGEAKATNAYNQAISDSISKQQQQAISNWLDIQKLNQTGASNELGWAQQALATQKYGTDLQNQQFQQDETSKKNLYASPDLYGIVANFAGQSYANPSEANSATEAIMQAYQNTQGGSLGDFLNQVTQGISDPLEAEKRKRLAAIMWQSVGNKAQAGMLN
jgi:hypothetical protein